MNARSFFTELTRRRVYSVAAWLIRRLAPRLSPNFGMLKLNPLWEPLRGDPRFEKFVAAKAPKNAKP